jgi:hypothetical protein
VAARFKSYTEPSFWKAYRALPESVRSAARDAYRRFEINPSHPGLQFKRGGKKRPVYSVRIGLDHRALGVVSAGTVIWFWIGPHAEYDRLLKDV